ncbi:MAG: hypothetical protein ACYS99_17545 [Planctomycetota bacterium]|jgi:hypothetical protein
MRRAALLLLALSLSLFVSSDVDAKRSFVGKRLPGPFTDARGHEVNPRHYHGSVLVVFGGIPW